jgi:hypothetical protein
MQLSQISHSSVDNSSLDPARLHSHSHDTTQHSATLPSGLFDYDDYSRSNPWVPGGNPCSPNWTPMGRLASTFSSFGINLKVDATPIIFGWPR